MKKELFYLAAFLLSTIFVNPYFYWRIIKNNLYNTKSQKKLKSRKIAREKELRANGEKLSDYKNEYDYYKNLLEKTFNVSWIRIVVWQIVFGTVGCLFLFWINMYYFMPYTIVTLINGMLLFAILQFINALFSFSAFIDVFDCDKAAKKSSLLTALAMIVISVVVPIAQKVYTNSNVVNVEAHMQKQISDIPTIDESEILKTAKLVDGYSLSDPVYRNGNWIYVPSRDGNIASPGYFLVKGKDIKYIPKTIKYSEHRAYKYNPRYIAREMFPNKAFFGDVTLQIDSKSNTVYYAVFYGEYKFLKSGRKMEGIILVDVESGRPSVYDKENIPEFVQGIAE